MLIRGDLEQITPESMDEHYRVNLRAPLFLSQKVLPHLKKTKGRPKVKGQFESGRIHRPGGFNSLNIDFIS